MTEPLHVDDSELEDVDPDEVPTCPCGRTMRIETAVGEWKCSKCDPKARERWERTQRVLKLREQILARKR